MSSSSILSERGFFIVFEGTDRCGKTTQSKKLVNYLNCFYSTKLIKYISFPNRKCKLTGHLLDSYLKKELQFSNDNVVHLLFSMNRWQMDLKIRKWLMQGKIIVSDRYFYSGIAYSVAKQSSVQFEWACETDKGLVLPDIVFYLEQDLEKIENKKGFGEEIFDIKSFQERVHQVFKLYESTKLTTEKWINISSSDDIEKIHDQIIQEIKKLIK